jgi:hypothetical protein
MSNWKSIVGKVAPMLAGTFGTPFMGVAVKYLADEFLLDGGETANPEKELEKLFESPSPELLAKLKAIDADFETRMADIGLKKEQLHAKDRDSARSMASKTSIKPQLTLSIIFILGYFGLLGSLVYMMMVKPDLSIPPELAILFGVMSAAVPQILNFWFGSSRSSQSKDDHHAEKERATFNK